MFYQFKIENTNYKCIFKMYFKYMFFYTSLLWYLKIFFKNSSLFFLYIKIIFTKKSWKISDIMKKIIYLIFFLVFKAMFVKININLQKQNSVWYRGTFGCNLVINRSPYCINKFLVQFALTFKRKFRIKKNNIFKRHSL